MMYCVMVVTRLGVIQAAGREEGVIEAFGVKIKAFSQIKSSVGKVHIS